MKYTWKIVLGALTLSIIAGLAVQWIDKKLNGTQTTAQTGWARSIFARNALANLNTRPQCAASAYQTGACVTNYRPFLRRGSTEVPVS